MNTDRSKTLRMVMLAMMVAIGVVISPILRIEGMCPTAHLINIVCSVLLGPWYSLLCARNAHLWCVIALETSHVFL